MAAPNARWIAGVLVVVLLAAGHAQQPPGPDATWAKRALFGFCQKAGKLRGEDLSNAIGHNLPRAMFVFLPLLALVMKALYWRPKRFYVEHLLLLVHNHASRVPL